MIHLLATLFLAATATGAPATQAPVSGPARSQTIAGFTIPVTSTWEPPDTNGDTTVLDGRVVQNVSGHDAVMVMHSVRVTDLSSITPVPTEDEVFNAHEADIRSLEGMNAQNLRRDHAHIGTHTVLILSGSARILDEANHPRAAYVFSLAFVANSKAYEFSQVSMYEDALDAIIKTLPAFTLEEGGKDVALTGGPTDLVGEYTIDQVPFAVSLLTAPHAELGTDVPGYALAYGASDLQPLVGPQYSYQLRRLNDDDKRSDADIFWDIARTMLDTGSAFNKPALFTAKDGTGTVEAEYSLGSARQSVRFRYQRVDSWAAVLAARTTPEHKADLQRLGLRLVE